MLALDENARGFNLGVSVQVGNPHRDAGGHILGIERCRDFFAREPGCGLGNLVLEELAQCLDVLHPARQGGKARVPGYFVQTEGRAEPAEL